MVIGNISLESG